jgi:superfamily II DNA or RNA helicase
MTITAHRALSHVHAMRDHARQVERRPIRISEDHLRSQADQAVATARRLLSHVGQAQILRDPVGTGKTAVALVAARLLLDAEEIEYCLIVSPKKLVANQWANRAQPLFAGQIIREGPARTKWAKNKVIFGTHRAHPTKPSPKPDRTLVVIDEAHSGLQSESTEAQQAALKYSRGAMTLLVTATPFQMTTTGFINMLSVAGPLQDDHAAALRDYGRGVSAVVRTWDRTKDLQATMLAADQLQPARKLATKVLTGRLLPKTKIEVPTPPKLKLHPVPLGSWADAYATARIIPELIGVGKNDSFQRRLTSSSETVWDPNRKVGEAIQQLRDEGDPAIIHFFDLLKDQLGEGTQHPKVAATVDWILQEVKRTPHGRHVVVFTSWPKTQEVIGRALVHRELERVDAPTEGKQIDDDLLERFMKPPRGEPVVLVLSDRFSESIDLDGGRPSIVHHDLSWNPVRLTQRWGRVVRLQTRFQEVQSERIFAPVLDAEVDLRLARTVAGRKDLSGSFVPESKEDAEAGEHDGWILPDDILRKVVADFG